MFTCIFSHRCGMGVGAGLGFPEFLSLDVCTQQLDASLQVSAYGFITSNYWKFSDHYYDRVKQPLIFYANHDLSLEAELWWDLHKAGILKLYQHRA